MKQPQYAPLPVRDGADAVRGQQGLLDDVDVKKALAFEHAPAPVHLKGKYAALIDKIETDQATREAPRRSDEAERRAECDSRSSDFKKTRFA
jgi:hypothetical protein